jgi:hypothetical protein
MEIESSISLTVCDIYILSQDSWGPHFYGFPSGKLQFNPSNSPIFSKRQKTQRKWLVSSHLGSVYLIIDVSLPEVNHHSLMEQFFVLFFLV